MFYADVTVFDSVLCHISWPFISVPLSLLSQIGEEESIIARTVMTAPFKVYDQLGFINCLMGSFLQSVFIT